MLTSNIKFRNFNIVKKKYKKNFLKEKWFKEIKLLESLKHNYTLVAIVFVSAISFQGFWITLDHHLVDIILIRNVIIK